MDLSSIPKIENHLHMEGAIPYETLWQLILKYGGDESVKNPDQLKGKFRYLDFSHFIEMWIWKNRFIREYEDFSLISEAVARDLISQNIRYAEVFISPSLFRKKLQTQKIVEAIVLGIEKCREIKINLIVDLVRDYGPENELKTLYEINEVKNLGIIGIGIGGSEHRFPPELFVSLYEKARNLGFKTTAHAGEAAGPESVWKAIRELKADRIGHGTRAIEDPGLMDYIAEHQIPVELCPLSNLRTKVIDSIHRHPVKAFIDRGIPVSINTDDPKMFGNSLEEEYQAIKNAFGFSEEEIKKIIADSIHTTWLDQTEKEKLISEFEREKMLIKSYWQESETKKSGHKLP